MTLPQAIVARTRAAGAVAGSGVSALREVAVSLGARSRDIRWSWGSRYPAPDHFDGRRFRNTEPDSPITARAVVDLLRRLANRHDSGRPARPVPVQRPDIPDTAADLAATWLGHAMVLFEVDGARVLADPVVADRVSPADFAGPRRLHPAPAMIAELPAPDAIVISHDHYDHLDRTTVLSALASTTAPFLVPLGIGAHLARWGVPAARIVELDWGGEYRVGPLTITATPARHFSGRSLARNSTLWCSWVIAGPAHRVFFGGDTGYTAAFAEIGRRYGPFDLAALPIGAYDAAWPDIHMTPEQAARAHRDLGAGLLLPIHWATFDLAPHPWSEPVERLLQAAGDIVIPRPGQRVDQAYPVAEPPWWR